MIIVLKEIVKSQFTMVQASFPFTFDLPQGSGQAEYKSEFDPYGWKVDIWYPGKVLFNRIGIFNANLETREDGTFPIERGFTYKFGLVESEPIPEPQPSPTPEPPPEPTPVPPIPSVVIPKYIGIHGSTEVIRPLITFWGTSSAGTTDVVWTIPWSWYLEAWNLGMPTLLEKMNQSIIDNNYDVEYLIRR
jgi:hypothetical protein